MKKLFAAALSLVMMMSLLAACGTKAPEETQVQIPDVDMATMVDDIYANHTEIDLPLMTNPIELSDPDMVLYNTGLSHVENVQEAVVSEAMMGQPYSLVLVKTKDAASAAAVAQEMFDNIDQRKWICVEADTKTVAYVADVVMLFMVNSDFSDTATTQSMVEAFQKTVGTDVTVIG